MTGNLLWQRALVVGAAYVLGAAPSSADIVAQTPTISSNGWVALGIISAFVGTIYLLIMGALHVERRDARLGRRAHDDGWFGVVRTTDDDDPPDFHQNGN
jgi:hypothetical protein